MRMNVIGIKRIKGDKSKAGNPYDICSIFATTPIEKVANEKLTITGAGFEIAEISFDPEQLTSGYYETMKFPAQLDLKMDSVPRFGRFESICVGFEHVTKP